MFCKNCGSPLRPGDKFCNNCGQTVDSNNMPPQPPQVDFNQAPQGDFNQMPQNGYNQAPQGNFNQMPQNGYNQAPQGNFNQMPQNGYNQAPQGNFNQMPQNGYNQAPQGNFNQMPQNGYNQPEPKKNNSFIIIVIVLIVAIAGVVLYLLLRQPANNNGGNPGEIQTDPVNTGNTPSEEPINISNNDAITDNGYQFIPPTGYVLKNTGSTNKDFEKAFVNTNSKTLIYVFANKNIPFTTYKNSVEALKKQIASGEGVTVTGHEIKAVSGVELLAVYGTVKTNSGTFSFMDVFSSIGAYDTGEYLLYSYTSKRAKNFLSDVAEIAKSVKYTGSSSFAPGEENKEATATNGEFVEIEEFKTDEPNVLEEDE